MKNIECLFVLAFFGCVLIEAQQTNSAETLSRPAIVSPSRPMDSRGETVYQGQGEGLSDQPIIPGILLPPRPIKVPVPKYSKAMRKEKFKGEVDVEGVVATNGEMIDVQAAGTPDPDAKEAAVKAVSGYRFKPATRP